MVFQFTVQPTQPLPFVFSRSCVETLQQIPVLSKMLKSAMCMKMREFILSRHKAAFENGRSEWWKIPCSCDQSECGGVCNEKMPWTSLTERQRVNIRGRNGPQTMKLLQIYFFLVRSLHITDTCWCKI